MKKPLKNVLPFPEPAQELETSPVLIEIGGDRLAIHFQIEDLPPVVPASPPRMQLARLISSKRPSLSRRKSKPRGPKE